MDDWIIVTEFDWNLSFLKEFLKMLPVVNLLVKLKTVVILIHFNVIWILSVIEVISYNYIILPGKYFSKYPSVREISLWVLNFIS